MHLPRVEQALDVPRPRRLPLNGLKGWEIVLVAEDEAALRELMREGLESKGYTVLEARDGKQAVDIAKAHTAPIHLLVTDVLMPGMNGPQVVQYLGPLLPSMKVLFISGYSDRMLHEQSTPGEAGHFLQKPFRPVDLARKAREILDHAVAPAARRS